MQKSRLDAGNDLIVGNLTNVERCFTIVEYAILIFANQMHCKQKSRTFSQHSKNFHCAHLHYLLHLLHRLVFFASSSSSTHVEECLRCFLDLNLPVSSWAIRSKSLWNETHERIWSWSKVRKWHESLYLEQERWIGWNIGRTARWAICVFWRTRQNTLLAFLHRSNAQIKRFNHNAFSQLEFERFIAIQTGIEFRSIG